MLPQILLVPDWITSWRHPAWDLSRTQSFLNVGHVLVINKLIIRSLIISDQIFLRNSQFCSHRDVSECPTSSVSTHISIPYFHVISAASVRSNSCVHVYRGGEVVAWQVPVCQHQELCCGRSWATFLSWLWRPRICSSFQAPNGATLHQSYMSVLRELQKGQSTIAALNNICSRGGRKNGP